VADVGWSGEKAIISSCEENNTLQIWKMTDSLLAK
jgi:hypothetical protein